MSLTKGKAGLSADACSPRRLLAVCPLVNKGTIGASAFLLLQPGQPDMSLVKRLQEATGKTSLWEILKKAGLSVALDGNWGHSALNLTGAASATPVPMCAARQRLAGGLLAQQSAGCSATQCLSTGSECRHHIDCLRTARVLPVTLGTARLKHHIQHWLCVEKLLQRRSAALCFPALCKSAVALLTWQHCHLHVERQAVRP